ncbi:hypothetical protein IPJ70_02970 [Candidatus Campbellbacteria bacterium]|nr:MAG: hypothetical protein IPJ70_02970 [Candidatus Campbellbacteria bacterium]
MKIEALKGLPLKLKLVSYEVLTDMLEGEVATLKANLEEAHRELVRLKEASNNSESALKMQHDTALEQARTAEARLEESRRSFDTLIGKMFSE